jgi:TolB-like protein
MRQRIDGWKAIGRYLGRNARTAQMWERDRGLPVHRIPGSPGRSLFAYADELDGWLVSKEPRAGLKEAPSLNERQAPALLVLPFDCNSLDTSLQFVADGMAEELIGRLACTQLSSMRIVSWTTAKTFRDKPMAAASLSRKLGVRYLIEGCVLAAGERWRVDVRLVDAQADRVLFGDRFGCADQEVLLLQVRIAEAVAGHLSLVMAGDLTEPM